MHLAYRESSPTQINTNFHLLASDPIKGPKLRIPIPEALHIEVREENPPAIDRLINYNKDNLNLDLDQFDAYFTKSYTPDSKSEAEEKLFFKAQMDWLNSVSTESIEDSFSQSIHDCDLPEEVVRDVRTRDALKQFWEASCALADDMGDQKAEAKTVLHDHLKEFNKYCHNVRSQQATTHDLVTGKPDRGKVMAMTDGCYTGTTEQVYTTHHM